MTMDTMGPARSWREENRQDRLARAQIGRDQRAADAELRIAERQARAAIRREDDQAWRQGRLQARQARRDARLQARQDRAARRAALAARIREHVIDLLFIPVIGIPAVLAWTAMAAYGYAVYGPPGLMLPAMSEGSMWAFAVATTLTRHRTPDAPLWHLRAGTVIFAAIGAALNFIHGLAAGSVVTGALMAIVSVAGVTAHQLVTAGPRRSRAQRRAARLERAARRREMAARRAAVRRSVVELDEDGSARLIYTPGTVTLSRRLFRTRLTPVRIVRPAPAEPGPHADAPADDAGGPADDELAPDPDSVDKDAVISHIACQIADAVDASERWKPDYAALMAATGRSRRWCEDVVRRARDKVLEPPPGPDAVTAGATLPHEAAEEAPARADGRSRTDPASGEPALAGAP